MYILIKPKKPSDQNILDKRINSTFVSYFLTLLHEEGNKFLSNRTLNQQPIIEETHTSEIPQKNFKKLNSENLFDSSFSASNTPKSTTSHRKISLQPINNSPRSINNSPIDLFNHLTRNKKGNLSVQSTPTSNYSPKTMSYSSKLTNRATLFDYIATPVKSPTYVKSTESPAIISDFKNRFQQHQQQLQHNNSSGNNSTPQSQDKSPLAAKFDQIQEEYVVIDKKDIDECKKMQFLNLGSTIKESLNKDEMDRLSILATFYSQLILSIAKK